jgi:hypothetical protein
MIGYCGGNPMLKSIKGAFAWRRSLRHDGIVLFLSHTKDELESMACEATESFYGSADREHLIGALNLAVRLKTGMQETIEASDKYEFRNKLELELAKLQRKGAGSSTVSETSASNIAVWQHALSSGR